jgi:hypothetical protein
MEQPSINPAMITQRHTLNPPPPPPFREEASCERMALAASRSVVRRGRLVEYDIVGCAGNGYDVRARPRFPKGIIEGLVDSKNAWSDMTIS